MWPASSAFTSEAESSASTCTPAASAAVSRWRVSLSGDGASAGGDRAPRGTPPVRSGGGYRTGGGMSQASKQNETGQRFMSEAPRATPVPRFQSSDGATAPRYRVPAAPQRQPQADRPSPQREYRGTSSAPRFVAPRAESFTAAPGRGEVRSAPHSAGPSYRGGGGDGAAHRGRGSASRSR